MKIHYAAPSWHGGYQWFFGKALRSLGHEVFYFDDNGTPAQKWFRRIAVRIPRLQYSADDIYRNKVSRDWLTSVRALRPDLVVVQHAPNILAEYIRAARRDGMQVFYWTDSHPTGTQAKDSLAGAKEASKVFSVDRKWMTILYAPDDFSHLPVAGDPETFHPIAGAKKKYDVTYLGSMPPATSDGYLRAHIIANLPKQYRIAAFGNGADYWKKYFPILRERVKGGKILSFEEMNEIYNESEIVLNIHSTSNATSLSARTYEIALSGAFQLIDWREDIDAQFPKGSFISFRYAKEINGLISEWLPKLKERAEQTKVFREHVLAHHTWRHRAEEMLGYLKSK